MARRLLGTAVTDENGEATIEYTGTGAGELHIVAESGTFSSNVITIDDYDPIIDSATITSDKNIIQSGESANLTVIGKDKHNELVNEDTFDLCEQFIVSKVSVDSTGIVQSGSNLDIKAKVNTSLGGVPNNVPVVFKKGDETLDTVQTSASGIATYPYPGTGVGEVNITAECDGVVSETYSIFDCWSYNPCTSEVANYFTFTRCTGSYSDNGMKVVSSSSTQSNSLIFDQFKNVDTSKNYVLEFELISANEINLRTDVSTNSVISTNTGSFNTSNIIRLEYDFTNNLIKYYLNGSYVTSKEINNYSAKRALFYIIDYQYDLDITIKNIKIYLI